MADRISSLPDELVCHILSFLPTKEAVATSVLAKNWKPLWLSVPTLHFNDQNYLQNEDTYSRFLQSVYTVMLLRDASQPIQSFNLECKSPLCNTYIVNVWVTAAIQRKVERLSLSLFFMGNLPSCILTSTTLVVLNLKGLIVKTVSSVSFPSLKTLHLRGVYFPGPGFLFEVLSSCPVLEDLLMSSVLFNESRQINFLPKLIKADISSFRLYIPIAPFCKAEFLRIEVVCMYYHE
uniref:F-box/LRR-repeat protein At5g41840 family n=1 Tax=Cajanus cajan TaxID=3821 RepID=A0A151SML1_CAJCA|nr:Putative F-box/LRR-repeat protein At5g41840 family [Cajanus cajan]